MSKPNHAIVCFLNDRYFDYFRACINSLKQNYPGHPTVLAAYDGQSSRVANYLEREGITRIAPEYPEVHASVNRERLIDPIVFHRFSLWTDFFDEYDNLLHLDIDTLVLGPLNEIVASQDFFIVANHEPSPAARVFHDGSEGDPVLARRLREDGLTYPSGMDDMANAGVFVIPRKYRCRSELDTLDAIFSRYGPWVRMADQSLISLWCKLRGIPYSREFRYNCQSPLLRDAELGLKLEDIHVLHFSNHKPDSEKFMEWNRIEGLQATLRGIYERYLEPRSRSVA